MKGARVVVDAKPAAQRVKRRRRAGETAPGDGQRIKRAVHSDKRLFDPAELRIQEFHIECSVMDNQLGVVANEIQKVLGDSSEQGLITQKIVAKAVHFERTLRHGSLRVDILVIGAARGHVVYQLNRADFDNAIAVFRLETGGFSV